MCEGMLGHLGIVVGNLHHTHWLVAAEPIPENTFTLICRVHIGEHFFATNNPGCAYTVTARNCAVAASYPWFQRARKTSSHRQLLLLSISSKPLPQLAFSEWQTLLPSLVLGPKFFSGIPCVVYSELIRKKEGNRRSRWAEIEQECLVVLWLFWLLLLRQKPPQQHKCFSHLHTEMLKKGLL